MRSSVLAGILLSLGCASHGDRSALRPATSVPASAAAACTLMGTSRGLSPISRTSSTVALARDGKRTLAFVSDEDMKRVVVVDLESKNELAALDLGARPAGLLVSRDGHVIVTVPERSELRVLDFDGGRLASACAVPTPAEPVALAVTPNDRRLLVVSAWGHALTTYSTNGLRELGRLDLAREPRAVVVSEDGSRAFVAHALGGLVSAIDLATHAVERVTLDAPLPSELERRQALIPVPVRKPFAEDTLLQARTFGVNPDRPARVGSQGFALAISVDPPGRVLVPQVEVDPGPANAVTPGYGSGGAEAASPTVAIVDAKSLERELLPLEPPPPWGGSEAGAGREPCRLPRAAAVDPGSGLLLIACLGVDALLGFDAASPNPVDSEVLRVSLPSGPTGLAIDAERRRAIVWSSFDRVLSVVPLPKAGGELATTNQRPTAIAFAALPGRAVSAEIALGRRLFHATDDPRISRDGRACASCHIEGRDDGLVWSTPAGPRRTKSLAAVVAGTEPYSWDGSAETLHDQLDGTFERLGAKRGLSTSDRNALVAYLRALPAPPRTNDADEARVRRGAALFASEKAGCAGCHVGANRTDGTRHAVASRGEADVTMRFDTPSLRFLEGRAPYFHDGRYETLHELLVASDGKMGHTAQLSASDLVDLEAYLERL